MQRSEGCPNRAQKGGDDSTCMHKLAVAWFSSSFVGLVSAWYSFCEFGWFQNILFRGPRRIGNIREGVKPGTRVEVGTGWSWSWERFPLQVLFHFSLHFTNSLDKTPNEAIVVVLIYLCSHCYLVVTLWSHLGLSWSFGTIIQEEQLTIMTTVNKGITTVNNHQAPGYCYINCSQKKALFSMVASLEDKRLRLEERVRRVAAVVHKETRKEGQWCQ